MPALNIEFTDAELEQLRQRARSRGVSLRTLAHDTIVSAVSREQERGLIGAEYQRAKAVSAGLLQRLADQ
jgi:hypothetical protein